MKLEDSTALVTGANRGLGRALVDALLAAGARRIYAASREGSSHPDPRVVSLRLDVTNPAQAREAAAAAPDVQLLINNAGVCSAMPVLDGDPEQLRRDLEVNYYGTLNVVRAFVPVLTASPGSAIVNVLSITSMASMRWLGGYSASKAAAWSLTQALRIELRDKGVRIHAAFPGAIDTDMTRGFDIPKTPPDHVARGILEGVAADQEDIAPDPASIQIRETFVRDPREIERLFGA